MPPACHSTCGSASAYTLIAGATANPISSPKPSMSTTARPMDRSAVTFIPKSTAKAAMNRGQLSPLDASRPAYAPTANSAVVTATRPIVCPINVLVSTRITGNGPTVVEAAVIAGLPAVPTIPGNDEHHARRVVYDVFRD